MREKTPAYRVQIMASLAMKGKVIKYVNPGAKATKIKSCSSRDYIPAYYLWYKATVLSIRECLFINDCRLFQHPLLQRTMWNA